jgi:hypothetical protein
MRRAFCLEARDLDHPEQGQYHDRRKRRNGEGLQASHPVAEKEHHWASRDTRKALHISATPFVESGTAGSVGPNVVMVITLATEQAGKAEQAEQAPREIIIVIFAGVDDGGVAGCRGRLRNRGDGDSQCGGNDKGGFQFHRFTPVSLRAAEAMFKNKIMQPWFP